MSWRDIPGHFNFADLYDDAVASAVDGDVLVEVGVLNGRSLAYLGERALESGKRLRVVGVDLFGGGGEHWKRFVRYMSDYARPAWGECIDPVMAPSVEAAKRFADGSLRFVFIDADHSYEAVREDIHTWLPKVKVGGVLAGHDYNEADWPGVVHAVREVFGDLPPAGVELYCWRFEVEFPFYRAVEHLVGVPS